MTNKKNQIIFVLLRKLAFSYYLTLNDIVCLCVFRLKLRELAADNAYQMRTMGIRPKHVTNTMRSDHTYAVYDRIPFGGDDATMMGHFGEDPSRA